MAIDRQRRQAQRRKNQRQIDRTESSDPVVFYRERSAETGIHEFTDATGNILRAHLIGNAQPYQGESMVYVPPQDPLGIGQAYGRNVQVEERAIASIPREEYAIPVLFRKTDPGTELWSVLGSITAEGATLEGPWTVSGPGVTSTATPSTYNVSQVFWLPGQTFFYQGFGTFTDSTNIVIRLQVVGPTSGILRIFGSFSRTSDRENIPGPSSNRLSAALESQNVILPWVTPSAPGTYSIDFDLTVPSDGTIKDLGATAGGFIGNGSGGFGSGLIATSSFEFSFTITTDVGPPGLGVFEFWLGGDRLPLLLWELNTEVDYIESISSTLSGIFVTDPITDSSITSLPYQKTENLSNADGDTFDYSFSIDATSLRMSGAGQGVTVTNPDGSIDNPAAAARWEVDALVNLGFLEEGIYLISGFFSGGLTGDFSKSSRLDVTSQGDEILSFQGIPTATFTATWGPAAPEDRLFGLGAGSTTDTQAPYFDNLVGTFTRVLSVSSGASFPLRVQASVGRAPSFQSQFIADTYDAGTFGGGLAWSVDYGFTISQVPEAYLAASKNFLYAFIKNSETARYIKIRVSGGIESSTEYTSPQTIIPDPQDWRKSRATFESAPATESNPCYSLYRFNDFANLQQNTLLTISPSQSIDGTPLQDRLIAGEGVNNAEITTRTATVNGSQCSLGSAAETQTVKTLEAIVAPSEQKDVEIIAIAPYRKR